MLDTELDLDFYIQPNRALLLLEAENFLEASPSENSPLRRHPSYINKKFQIIWDTRKIPSHQNSKEIIFIARKTDRFDSHSRVAELLNAGYIVIAQSDCVRMPAENQHGTWADNLLAHPNLICVSSTEKALHFLVQISSELKVEEWTTIAITGTNGKTSSTQIAAQLLEELSQQSVLRLGTLGIQIGDHLWDNPFPTQPDFPGLLASLRHARSNFSCTQLVMEATSIGVAENRLGPWPVQCAAFLNISQDHLDYHGTMEKYLEAKLDLFRKHLVSDGQVILNCEDHSWEKVIAASTGPSRLCLGFGKAGRREAFFEKAQQKFSGVRYLESSHQRSTLSGVQGQWTLWLDSSTALAQSQYAVSLLGEVQHDNVAAAAALMVSLGYPLNQIAGSCQRIRPIRGRLESVDTVQQSQQSTVLVDYAHSPDALEKTLRTCRSLLQSNGKLICVFGCGGDRDSGKRPIMGRIASIYADHVWITSDNPRTEDPEQIIHQILCGIAPDRKSLTTVNPDRKNAIFAAIQSAGPSDLVLIAGKGHEDYQIIGTTKYPFSDSDVARQALKSKSNI
jgi:UDP-N-acetylmuramyl-tripeptide synthetase